MKSIPRIIILLIGVCLFAISYGDKFPDEGRIKVGECLSDTLLWKEDEIENLEDNLDKFCESTASNYSFILEELKKFSKDSQAAYEEAEKCLGNDAENFLDRYKKGVPKSLRDSLKPTSLLPINEVAIGLCEEMDLVEFDKLDNDNEEGKPKAMRCFQDCAVKLFKKYEFIFTFLKREYEEMLQKNEPNPLLEDRGREQEVYDRSDQSEEAVRTKPSPQDFKLEINVDDFKEECKEKNVKDISTLSVIGQKYIKEYAIVVDALYEANPILEQKEKPFTCINSYFSCIRWRCAMAQEQDIPIKEFLTNILERRNEDPTDLITDFK